MAYRGRIAGRAARRVGPLLAVVLAAVAAPPRAGALPVMATVNGMSVTIGDLAYGVGVDPPNDRGTNAATFFLDAAYRHLMDDPLRCQFRWVQLIKQDDCPAEWNMNPITFGIDPPRGGWDYQQADGGADTSPFYENDDNGMYAYPNYADRHDAAQGKSWTDDFPGLCANPNQKTTWETYLVFANPRTFRNRFVVLAGYEWSVGRDAMGDPVFTSSNPFANLNAKLANIQTAMNNTGFAAWMPTVGTDLATLCVPEPSSLALAAVGLAALALPAARRSIRARRAA